MRLEGPALRLTIFIGETDSYRHRPLYNEIVRRARKAGLAGASVFHGIEGFGVSSRIHATHVLHLREERPITIVIVDAAERIRAFLPSLAEMIPSGLVTIDNVHVVHYADQSQPRERRSG